MKMKLFTLVFTISAIFITGCSSTYDSETIYDDSTIKEISAVREMNFESNKTDAYTRIASRTDLSEAAQVRLVKTVFDELSFDSSKSTVLLTLIDNPAFCPAAETAIMKRLGRLSFESTKNNILTAVNAVKTLHSDERDSISQ